MPRTDVRPRLRAWAARLLLCLAASVPAIAHGQETNRQVLERLAVACLTDAPGDLASFKLAAPDSLPYLRSALTEAWLRRGIRIAANPSPADSLSQLRYGVVHAGVTYQRLGRGSYRRDVSLGLEYTITDPAGNVRLDDVCRDAAVDTVRTPDLAMLEDHAFPETVGPRPAAGWMRRYLEPAVLVGAVAVGVFLFFSLRSDGGSD